MTLQAFMFGAYGFSLSAESNVTSSALQKNLPLDKIPMLSLIENARVVMAVMAFGSSIVLLCGIAAAAKSMGNLVDKCNERLAKSKDKFPQIIGESLFGRYGGLLPTYFLPAATAVVWWWLVYNERTAGILNLGICVVAVFFFLGILTQWSYGLGQKNPKESTPKNLNDARR